LTKTYCHYRQRWQVETVFSMLKRRLSSAVSGRSYWSQCRDLLLRVLTHNVMIRYLEVFYRAGQATFLLPS
ncbi:MAG TPA: transposase, partial [Nitrospira sp.]|nr:transposase [Nitrospira sp.]